MTDHSASTLIMVDDNIDEIFITRRAIRKAGIVNRFMTEQNPENLINTLDAEVAAGNGDNNFVIFLDVNMPKTNGFDVLRKIRQHPEYSDVLVFMLSCSEDESDLIEAEALGCDGYLVKPFSAIQLYSKMDKIARVKKQFLQ